MKTICGLLLVFTLSASAQHGGIYSPGVAVPTQEKLPAAAELRHARLARAENHPIRVYAGAPCNIIDDPRWQQLGGDVYAKIGNVLILRISTARHSWHYAGLTNYPGAATIDQPLIVLAVRSGTCDFDTQPIELYDYGIPYIPTPEAIAKSKAEAAARLESEKKRSAAQALKMNQDAAARGNTFALIRMGERYRDGDGVEKDLAKARDYFQKALASDPENQRAKELLAQLQAP